MSVTNATGFSLDISVPFAIAIRKSAGGVDPSFKSGQGRLLTILSWSMPKPTQAGNAMDGRRLSVQMAAGVVEAQALAPSDGIAQVTVPVAAAAHRTRKPGQRPVRPHQQHAVPVD